MFIAALNVPIDILIIQSQCNKWISQGRPIFAIRRYTNNKRYLKSYCTEVPIFTGDSCMISGINALMEITILYSVSERKSKRLKAVIFDVCKKHPQINWLPQQRPLSDFKTNVRLFIPTHMSIKAESLVEIGPACSETIGQICQFLQFFHKNTKINKSFSRVAAPNINEFVRKVATCNALLSLPSAFHYSYPFRNGSTTMTIFFVKKRRF